MKRIQAIKISFLCFAFWSCYSNSNLADHSPSLVITSAGQLGDQAQSADLYATYKVTDPTLGSLNFYNLSFDFNVGNLVVFYAFADAPVCAPTPSKPCTQSLQICRLTISLTADDIHFVQTKLSHVPICQYSVAQNSPPTFCNLIAELWPSGHAPYIATANEKIELGLASVCNARNSPWMSNCDSVLVSQVSQYLIQQIPAAAPITCSPQF